MRIPTLRRRHRKPPVELGQQLAPQKNVGLGTRRDLRQTHLLDPAILGRPEETLHTPFGLWTVCRDPFDAQLFQRSPKLRLAAVIGPPVPLRLVDAVPIRVQRQRTTVLPQPASQQIKVALHRLTSVNTS